MFNQTKYQNKITDQLKQESENSKLFSSERDMLKKLLEEVTFQQHPLENTRSEHSGLNRDAPKIRATLKYNFSLMKFLRGTTTPYSFLEAYKASETKLLFPYEWFDNPDKLEFPDLPPYEAFFSKYRNNNPLDKDFKGYEKLRKSGLYEQQWLKKFSNQDYNSIWLG